MTNSFNCSAQPHPRHSTLFAGLAALAVAALGSGSAHAQTETVCVTIDDSQDNLAPEERKAAVALVLQAFETENVAVDSSGTACTDTYVVTNVKLGKTINVRMSGPLGERSGRSNGLDDLPNIYSQMVKSLVLGVPMGTGGGATDRTNVTKEQAAPRRVAADALKYVQLGYGLVRGDGVAAGPSFGFGYRRELDQYGLDISFLNFTIANETIDTDGVTGSWLKLLGLYYQEPTADSTIYYGLGLSWGAAVVTGDNAGTFTGSGLQGEAVVGYAAFRSSTIRGFAQLNATFPFYTAKGPNDETRYTPYVVASVGIGWGKSNTVRVINE